MLLLPVTLTAREARDTLRLLINGSEVAGARVTTEDAVKRPANRKPLGECPKPEAVEFGGDSLEASAYFGESNHTAVNLKFEAVKGLFDKSKTFFVHCDLVKEMASGTPNLFSSG